MSGRNTGPCGNRKTEIYGVVNKFWWPNFSLLLLFLPSSRDSKGVKKEQYSALIVEKYSCSHPVPHLAWVIFPLSTLVHPPLPKQGPYQFPRAAAIKCHTLDSVNQQKFILSQFWRPEVQNQGLRWAAFPLKLWVESFLASSQQLGVLAMVSIPWCTCSSSASASVITVLSPLMCVCVSS